MATGRVPTTANSPLTAKGDLFTYSTAPARLAIGNNGESLVADSSTSTGLRYQGNFAAGKNKIINGDFGIWQRGTSFTPSAGVPTYIADRWRSVVNSGTTISRQTFTPGTAPVAGYEGQFYFNATITANNQNYEHGQFIENARTFAGQTIAVSFWARSTVGAQPMNVAVYQNFGTGGSPSSLVEVFPASGTTPFTPTSSWVRYTYTYNVPSVSGKTFGTNNDSYLWLRIGQYTTTATNTSIDYWGVQVEAGSVATAFQTATGTIQGELAACQRYYYRSGSSSSSRPIGFHLYGQGSTNGQAVGTPKVTMRVAPTSLEFSSLKSDDPGDASYAITAFTLGNCTDNAFQCDWSVASGSANSGNYILQTNTGGGYLAFSAEL